jgi:threonine/homoserine/homoserine lactone efflux protein
VPRVLNAALALFLLACVYPVVTTFADHSRVLQAYLVVLVVPVLLVAGLCAASALRPGSLGRALRRLRARRRG